MSDFDDMVTLINGRRNSIDSTLQNSLAVVGSELGSFFRFITYADKEVPGPDTTLNEFFSDIEIPVPLTEEDLGEIGSVLATYTTRLLPTVYDYLKGGDIDQVLPGFTELVEAFKTDLRNEYNASTFEPARFIPMRAAAASKYLTQQRFIPTSTANAASKHGYLYGAGFTVPSSTQSGPDRFIDEFIAYAQTDINRYLTMANGTYDYEMRSTSIGVGVDIAKMEMGFASKAAGLFLEELKVRVEENTAEFQLLTEIFEQDFSQEWAKFDAMIDASLKEFKKELENESTKVKQTLEARTTNIEIVTDQLLHKLKAIQAAVGVDKSRVQADLAEFKLEIDKAYEHQKAVIDERQGVAHLMMGEAVSNLASYIAILQTYVPTAISLFTKKGAA